MVKEKSLINEHNTLLLIVDIQERLIKAITNHDSLLNNVIKLIKASEILDIGKIYTEQNPHKLGPTINILKSSKNSQTYHKMSFSCCECIEVKKALADKGKINIVICGIESHICILQTALDLLRSNYNVIVVIDAVASRNCIDHEISIQRLHSNGAVITTTEAVIFELCRTAKRPEFKEISTLIKN